MSPVTDNGGNAIISPRATTVADSARLEYRADIDYLRAIAVVSVIGFHYDLPGFGGGFVGVDIFFVISGYVISRLIWTGIQSEAFSFLRFYERRARRLLPALYMLIFVTGIVAWFLAPPNDYRMFFGSAISTLLFSSNVFFWLQTGYFDLPTIGKVLIHTWSLSVEEQFYFLFPLIMWLWSKLFRDPASRMSLVLVISGTVALCILDELWIKQSASAAFYFAPLRAWEFLIGGIVFFMRRWSPETRKTRLAIALIGTALVLLPVAVFKPETRFPGFHAAIPCLGTALYIIAFNKQQGRPRLPLEAVGVFFGRLSYSLYLWHWPVFVLGRAALPLEVVNSPLSTVALLLFSFTFAYLSYRTVETPARTRVQWKRVRVSGLIAGMAVILISVGAHGFFNSGYSGRFPQSQERLLRYSTQTLEPFYGIHSCFLEPDEPFSIYNFRECLTFSENKRNVLLAGDSTAAHYVPALREYLSLDSYNLLQLTSAACAPFVEVKQKNSKNCNDINQLLRVQITNKRLSAIILSANWRWYVEALKQPAQEGSRQQGDPIFTSQFDVYLGALLSAAQDAGVPVLLFGPSLEFPVPLATTLFNYELTHMPVGNAFAPVEEAFKADDQIRGLARSYRNVQFVSVLRTVCEDRLCPVKADPETPIVWDIIHLTPEGSKLVISKMKPQLDVFLSKIERHSKVAGDNSMDGGSTSLPTLPLPSSQVR
jgi:peptidoglycan/LPS O-acetylase OafA/YrhL